MSRIGNKAVEIPTGVSVAQDGNTVTVKGPQGELTRTFSSDIKLTVDGNVATLARPDDTKEMKMIHGTTRALLDNMVIGVSKGFQKSLELIGVGYRAQLKGNKLVLNVGYSHPVEFTAPEGVSFEVPANTQVIVKGASKEAVGEIAADIREVRPPEPYKGKGIRYTGEYVRRKEGKTGK